MKIRNLTITAFLIAINVVLSSLIVIPLGPIKAAPVQHFINVLCAVFVGPWYGLAQAPWGGYKQSGIGRELGKEGLEEYLITKHILTNTNPEPVNWFSK